MERADDVATSLVTIPPNQETAECIIEILQDTNREGTEHLVVILSTASSSNTMVEVTIDAAAADTSIGIFDDEGKYIIDIVTAVD